MNASGARGASNPWQAAGALHLLAACAEVAERLVHSQVTPNFVNNSIAAVRRLNAEALVAPAWQDLDVADDAATDSPQSPQPTDDRGVLASVKTKTEPKFSGAGPSRGAETVDVRARAPLHVIVRSTASNRVPLC